MTGDERRRDELTGRTAVEEGDTGVTSECTSELYQAAGRNGQLIDLSGRGERLGKSRWTRERSTVSQMGIG